MKKRIACFLAVLLLFTAGCSKQSSTVNLDVDGLADQIIKAVKFSDQMSVIKQKTAVTIYGLDEKDVVKSKVYESTGATAEEVAVFEGKDETAAANINKAALNRVETQRTSYKDYQPKEIEKLKNPLIVTKGKYVILCIADDTSPAQKAIDEAAK